MTRKAAKTHRLPAPMFEGAVPLRADVAAILGPPPLLAGEDPDHYDALHDRLRVAIAPMDIVDEMFLRTIANLMWESMRLWRQRAAILRYWERGAFEAALTPLTDGASAAALTDRWLAGDPIVVKEVERLLAPFGASRTVVGAHALWLHLVHVQSIDAMIARAEARWNAALRDLERHDSARAGRVRDVAATVEDAEFTAAEPVASLAAA